MKKFTGIAVLFAALVSAAPLYAAVVDYGVIPQKPDFIVISGDLEQLFAAISNVSRDASDSREFDLVMELGGRLDRGRMALAGFDVAYISNLLAVMTDFDASDASSAMWDGFYSLLPLDSPFEQAMTNSGLADECFSAGAGVYQYHDLYLTGFKTGGGSYVLFVKDTNMIARYVKSAKLSSNPSADNQDLVRFLNDNRNRPLAYYMSGGCSRFYSRVTMERLTSNSMPPEVENFLNIVKNYGLMDIERFDTGYADSLSLPLRLVFSSSIETSAPFWKVFSPSRETAAAYLDTDNLLAFTEIDLQPSFILDAAVALGITNSGVTPDQLNQAVQTINGTFAAAIYLSAQDNDLSQPPAFIGFAGLNNRDFAELLIAMAVEYDKITISGREVFEIPTLNQTYPRVYVLLDTKDAVVASSRDLIAMYVKNATRGVRPLADALAAPAGYSQPYLFSIPSSRLLSLLLRKWGAFHGFQEPKRIDLSVDISGDGRVMEARIELK